MRITILLLLFASLLGGCSLFGIATKGELRDMERANEAQRENLRRVVADINAQLAELSQEIDGVVASIDAAQREQETLRSELAGFEGTLDQVSSEAAVAREQSQRALRAQLQRLLDERARLRQQLAELDRQIQGWSTPLDSTGPEADLPQQRILP